MFIRVISVDAPGHTAKTTSVPKQTEAAAKPAKPPQACIVCKKVWSVPLKIVWGGLEDC